MQDEVTSERLARLEAASRVLHDATVSDLCYALREARAKLEEEHDHDPGVCPDCRALTERFLDD